MLQSFSELRRFLGLNYTLTEADHFSRQSRKLPDSSFSHLRKSNSRKGFKRFFYRDFLERARFSAFFCGTRRHLRSTLSRHFNIRFKLIYVRSGILPHIEPHAMLLRKAVITRRNLGNPSTCNLIRSLSERAIKHSRRLLLFKCRLQNRDLLFPAARAKIESSKQTRNRHIAVCDT